MEQNIQMKAVILAGGLGTRISEESHLKPKPMIEIGGKPVLWHVMKIYAHYGVQDFIICCGYKGYVIKEYFANYFLHNSDVTFDLRKNSMTVHQNMSESWNVTLVDTGDLTQTGGRLKKIAKHLTPNEDFFFTYGDGVSDIDIGALLNFHRDHGRTATVTAVQPAGRFGRIDIAGDVVQGFVEKPAGDGGFINGGFFVLKPQALNLIAGDSTIWEKEPLESLAKSGDLHAYKHHGFWQPMDTLRDKNYLEELWASRRAPWKTWT